MTATTCRTYVADNWDVQVWVHPTKPWELEEVYLRCAVCQAGYSHHKVDRYRLRPAKRGAADRKYGHIIKANPCRCGVRAPYVVAPNACPPWLTRPEALAWRLGITEEAGDE